MGSVSLVSGNIQFRHPLVLDERGYGKPIKKGYGKYPLSAQLGIQSDLEKLLEAKPRLRADAPKCCKEALDAWFVPMERHAAEQRARNEGRKRFAKLRAKIDSDTTRAERFWDEVVEAGATTGMRRGDYGSHFDPRHDWSEDAYTFARHVIAKLIALEGKNNEQFKQLQQYEAEIEGMRRVMGERTAKQKTIRLRDGFTHWKARLVCASEAAKADAVRRVEALLEQIGIDMLYDDVTKSLILKANDELGGSDTEKCYRLRDAKRFFRDVSFPEHSDGLGLANPAVSIKPGTPSRGKIEVLDPTPIMANEKLPAYWRAMVACLGLAGMRLGEAASLEWGMLDEKARLIRLRATAHYPKLKNQISERDIPPFDEFWDTLAQHKKSATHEELVFPRIYERAARKHGEQETWFEDRDGQPRAINLPGALHDALKAAGIEAKQTALRLRHFWTTKLYQLGYGHVESIVGGHSSTTAKKHYVNNAGVAEKIKLGKLNPEPKPQPKKQESNAPAAP